MKLTLPEFAQTSKQNIMKTIIISIIALSLASCVTTTTTAPDGTVTVVRGVDPQTVETITAGVIAVGATIDQSSK